MLFSRAKAQKLPHFGGSSLEPKIRTFIIREIQAENKPSQVSKEQV